MSRQRYISRADLAAQNGALSEELYQLKLLLAGGEDAPGAAHAITLEDAKSIIATIQFFATKDGIEAAARYMDHEADIAEGHCNDTLACQRRVYATEIRNIGSGREPWHQLPKEREDFLTARVSQDGKVIGIDHPADAYWPDVLNAHVALRDHIDKRIAEQNKCPARKKKPDWDAICRQARGEP